MKNLVSKVTSTVTAVAVILTGCLLAGLGLTVAFYVMLFGLAVAGLGALIALVIGLFSKRPVGPL